MNARAVASEYRMVGWTKTMQERLAEGVSITEFCANRGISKNTYFYWQRKIREAACEQLALSGRRFTEVVAAQPPVGQINIAVGSVQITVDGSYPPDKLVALVRELART